MSSWLLLVIWMVNLKSSVNEPLPPAPPPKYSGSRPDLTQPLLKEQTHLTPPPANTVSSGSRLSGFFGRPTTTTTTQIKPGFHYIKPLRENNPNSKYTHKGCILQCGVWHGFAIFPATPNTPQAKIAVCSGMAVHSGNVCNCYPTQALTDKLKALGLNYKTQQTFSHMTEQISEESVAVTNTWLTSQGIQVIYPPAPSASPTSKGAASASSSSTSKGA